MPSKDPTQKNKNYRLAHKEQRKAYNKAYRDKHNAEINEKRRAKRREANNNNLPQLGSVRVATGGRDYELEEAFTRAEIMRFRNNV